MLFNSFEFFVFLTIVFFLYWYVFSKSHRWQNGMMLIASYFFYGWWSYQFLSLLALSTLLDYLYGFGVASSSKKKAKIFLWVSILTNVAILAVFKYYNFFVTEFQQGLEHIGFHFDPFFLDVVLPIGISFYTFHGMSYVFDIYRGSQKPVIHLVDYALFVSFFPLLVAGPIERASHLLPQIQRPRKFEYAQAVEGGRLILWGLFKKVMIADNLAPIVDEIFQNYERHDAITLIIGAIGFSFQIYGDFSGYSDMALGTAKLFGFELFSNFRFPYFARDVAEFWRRWHISLSSWFRDYLYIPLGGSKKGKPIAVRNTFVIFLVSGFWHGASWNFVVWGALHACGFLPLLLLNTHRKHVSDVVAQHHHWPSWRELWQMSTTFAFVTFAWVFFRAKDMASAIGYLKQIGISLRGNSSSFLKVPLGMSVFLYVFPLLLGDWFLRRNERSLQVDSLPLYARYLFYLLLMQVCFRELLLMTFRNDTQSFLYFQF